jgi:hypothetical protein
MARQADSQTAGRPDAAPRGALVGVLAGVVFAAAAGAITYAVWQTFRGRGAQFTYDLTALRQTDPNLIVCREIGSGFPTGFRTSRAIAVGPDAAIYVSGDQAVRKFDAAGRQVGEIAAAEPPGALAVGADGRIYAATAGRLRVYAADGALLTAWPQLGPNAMITSIAATQGEVFVADAGRRLVLRCEPSGKLLATIGRKDPERNVPGLNVPSPYLDVAMGPDGLLRVTNPGRHRIEAYTADGDFEFHWGEYSARPQGFCGCCNPVNFAILGGAKSFGDFDGFVTAEKGLTRVKIHDAEGRFVGVVAGPESFRRHDELAALKPTGEPFAALDVAVDGEGRILVLDPYVNQVRTFRRTGGGAATAATGTQR